MSAPKFTVDAMREAAEWLRCYEDDEGRERVQAVADWLDEQANARERRADTNRIVAQIVRESGCTPTKARAALAKARGEG